MDTDDRFIAGMRDAARKMAAHEHGPRPSVGAPDLYCLNLSSWAGERTGTLLARYDAAVLRAIDAEQAHERDREEWETTKRALAANAAALATAEAERDELRQLFDLQWSRMGDAVARWRAEAPAERELISPDLGRLLTWLLGQVDAGNAPTTHTRGAPMDEAKRRAANLLGHYLRTAWVAAGRQWNEDNDAEVDIIVDRFADMVRAGVDEHRQADPHIHADGSTG